MNTPISLIPLQTGDLPEAEAADTFEDEFLSVKSLDSVSRDAADRSLHRALGEIDELGRQKRWEDILALFHPVGEKAPDVVLHGLELELNLKIAFALGQLKRFDDAIHLLQASATKNPDNFSVHAGLGYTAYNSLYAGKNHEVFLSGKAKRDRLDLAHRHLKRAQELRPEGVTNFYRQGMLYKQIENNPKDAIPLFERAVHNWERLGVPEKERRHQERKNYTKALYNLASALLATERPGKSKEMLDKVLREDGQTNYISPIFKYYALGKVLFHLNRFAEAKDALVFSLTGEEDPVDFVHELLAKTYLAMGKVDEALKTIQRVPERLRRPYYRWTEAEVWCAHRDFQRARRVLLQTQERDRRSRHKTLIRLAKIEYLLGNFEGGAKCAAEAQKFFREKWGTPYGEGLFWRGLCLFRMGRKEEALETVLDLQRHRPNHPKLDQLLRKLREGEGPQP